MLAYIAAEGSIILRHCRRFALSVAPPHNPCLDGNAGGGRDAG
jgi:hypothetical protein